MDSELSQGLIAGLAVARKELDGLTNAPTEGNMRRLANALEGTIAAVVHVVNELGPTKHAQAVAQTMKTGQEPPAPRMILDASPELVGEQEPSRLGTHRPRVVPTSEPDPRD